MRFFFLEAQKEAHRAQQDDGSNTDVKRENRT